MGKPKNMLKRMFYLFLALVIVLSTGIVRVFYLTMVRGEELAQKAESQQLKDTEISAMRGTIYDNEGNVLAKSATVWNVFIDPLEIGSEERRQLIVNEFVSIFGYNNKETAELVKKTKEENHYQIVEKKIENNVKEQIADFVAENKLGDCIGFEQTTKRYYPYENLASSVIGFTGADDQGLSGIEAYYDKELTGSNGRIVTAKDAISNNIDNDFETSIEATDGYSLVLTINQTIQYYLEKGLNEALEDYQAKGAYGIVMDCNKGAVLAMASLPDFNCNEPYKLTYSKVKNEIKSKNSKKERDELESVAVQNQWRNFTVSDTYVPGSVFKAFISCAALEENVVTLDTSYTCTGAIQVNEYTMKCHYHQGHGTQTFTQGLENSCNPFFITVGQRLGVHNYFKYFDAFGFTQKTNVDLPGEASPQFYKEEQYSIVELSSASFGQTNSLTPIQVCTGICAIANGGTLLQPYLVSSIVDNDGKVIKKTEPTKVRQVISADTSEKVRAMMKSVVDNGTGKNGYVAGYGVGGKTGTSTKLGESAQGEHDKYIVSFAAIAPSENPEIAMLIIVDEPNEDLGGGALCAPIAAQVTEEAMSVLGIEPKYDEKELSNLSNYAPNVINQSLDKASKTIEEYGLKKFVIGKGDTVLRQCPTGDTTIPNGGTIFIYTDDSKKVTTTVPDFTGLTITEAKDMAKMNDLNLEIRGNSMSSGTVVAYRQSEEKNSKVEKGTVVTVSFKNTQSVLD